MNEQGTVVHDSSMGLAPVSPVGRPRFLTGVFLCPNASTDDKDFSVEFGEECIVWENLEFFLLDAVGAMG